MIERLIIVPESCLVSIDGDVRTDLDLSSLPETIHAVQWYGESGEIEYKPDAAGFKKPNEPISSLDPFRKIIRLFNETKPPEETEKVLTLEEKRRRLTDMTRAILNEKAQSRGYDTIESACSYVFSTDPGFAAEAKACAAWRDQVWKTCFILQNRIETGAIAMPDAKEWARLLPSLEWPATA